MKIRVAVTCTRQWVCQSLSLCSWRWFSIVWVWWRSTEWTWIRRHCFCWNVSQCTILYICWEPSLPTAGIILCGKWESNTQCTCTWTESAGWCHKECLRPCRTGQSPFWRWRGQFDVAIQRTELKRFSYWRCRRQLLTATAPFFDVNSTLFSYWVSIMSFAIHHKKVQSTANVQQHFRVPFHIELCSCSQEWFVPIFTVDFKQ